MTGIETSHYINTIRHFGMPGLCSKLALHGVFLGRRDGGAMGGL